MLVMIAENDGLHRTFARRTVEQLCLGDVEVIEASDGEDAINLAAAREPPHVVLDLQMPKATGIEVARGDLEPPRRHAHPVLVEFRRRGLCTRGGTHRAAWFGLWLCAQVGDGGGHAVGPARRFPRRPLHHRP